MYINNIAHKILIGITIAVSKDSLKLFKNNAMTTRVITEPIKIASITLLIEELIKSVTSNHFIIWACAGSFRLLRVSSTLFITSMALALLVL